MLKSIYYSISTDEKNGIKACIIVCLSISIIAKI